MVADSALPVWTIRPNWRNGITERLGWLTSIESSTIGTEQAIAFRLSPRREFEVGFNPVGDVRSYFDLWLHRLGSTEFMLPLWHDAGRLKAAIADDATVIPVDTTFREFVVGGLAVLVGDTPHDFDKVEITAIAPDSITVVAGGITRPWPIKSTIHPLRRARLSAESQIEVLTTKVQDGNIVFELNQANNIDDIGTWDGLLYNDLPVLTTKPNYREQLDMSFLRNRDLLDNDQGLREIGDEAGRAFTTQMHSFMLKGRAEHWAFRQMLYRLGGRQGAIWVPTYNQDFVLSRSRLAADAFLDIRKIGYDYTGGVVGGRNHVLIAGTTPAEIADVGVALDVSEERLTLAAALGQGYAAGTLGSFIDTCHLSSDDIEIVHHTDTDGTAECNLGFQSFVNDRTDDGPDYYPLAAAGVRTMECGTPPAVPLGNYWQEPGYSGADMRLDWPAGGTIANDIVLGFAIYQDPHDSWFFNASYNFTWPAGWNLIDKVTFNQHVIEFRWYRAVGGETGQVNVAQDIGYRDGLRSRNATLINLGQWAPVGVPYQDAEIAYAIGLSTDGAEALATEDTTAYSVTVFTPTTAYVTALNFSDSTNGWIQESEILCSLGMGADTAVSHFITPAGTVVGENRDYLYSGTWFNLNIVMQG